jgi:hypothetical protein
MIYMPNPATDLTNGLPRLLVPAEQVGDDIGQRLLGIDEAQG